MRPMLTWGVPLLLACALAQAGCGTPPATGSPPPDASQPPNSSEPIAADRGIIIPDLRLERLFAKRPLPRVGLRNPFRFGPASSPARPEPAVGGSPVPLPERTKRAAPNPPSPTDIPLRLIGIVQVGVAAGPVAVLTDAMVVHHGRAGDTVEGRYRIVSTGETSVDLEDLASGARMKLRLSGS